MRSSLCNVRGASLFLLHLIIALTIFPFPASPLLLALPTHTAKANSPTYNTTRMDSDVIVEIIAVGAIVLIALIALSWPTSGAVIVQLFGRTNSLLVTPITWAQQLRIDNVLEAIFATFLEAADATPDASRTHRSGGLSNPMSAAPRAQLRPERRPVTQADALPV